MKKQHHNYKDIPGWGMDADPENEPNYPMKNYTGDDHHRSDYQRSAPQPKDVEILMSNERPKMSAVFGNSVPPSGLSGMIRRYAFKHSEDRYRHWLPLIFADRVNMFEGVIDDLSRGYLPNMVAERGWKMEMKHNPKGFAVKIATVAAVGYAVYLILKKKK
ncbi:hypothetical protein [Pedobacter ureilyticus]|uniref:Uncharacterized protein n=1 Tax=Pedobacter ureilyticus TaxID=1393051 RepID=A0ABW9J9D1_9SPHI|nr:hypothetical protein [Pedobacter helvus]